MGGKIAQKWRDAIADEIMNFLKCNAWKKVPMSQVCTEECKLVPTKIVFKIKHEHNGTSCIRHESGSRISSQ